MYNGAKATTRPLSPHLQIYKPQITSVLSIFHRLTGIAMFFGTFLWVGWLVCLAVGPYAYACAQEIMLHPIGLLILLAWSFALFYHLFNGIRHLMWDAGLGLDMETVSRTGWIVVISSALLTVITWTQAVLWGDFWS